ncbi:hypothetical protein [Streptomyces sp. NPDC005012]|uniref:hypothetical protein n=1 Tax=Streptomyces sp. NPDC005012 TaxID=3154558 RepID=UPI00339E548E
MSTVVDFFTAPDGTTAARALRTGLPAVQDAFSCGNLDPEEAVLGRQALLTGEAWEDLVEAGEPRELAEEHDGEHRVFAVSGVLVAPLASAEPPRLRDAASAWSRSSAEDGTPVDEGTALRMLGGVAALARAAVERGDGLYCRAG